MDKLTCKKCFYEFYELEGLREDGTVCPSCNSIIKNAKFTPKKFIIKKPFTRQSHLIHF